MPIHSVFGYRILRLLDPEAYKNAGSRFALYKEALEGKKKFIIKKDEDKNIIATDQLGIASSLNNIQKINEMDETKKIKKGIISEHRNSLQRYSISKQGKKFQDFVDNDAPLAAGPSTHALSLFTAAYAYQNIVSIDFTLDELLTYALAYFVYLTTAGYHSFHEVMLSAATAITTNLEFSYNMGSYLENIPKSDERLYSKCKSIIERLSSELNQKVAEQIDKNFVRDFLSGTCPLTQEIMRDPVINKWGHTFDDNKILRDYHKEHHCCPCCRQSLDEDFNKAYIPNLTIKDMIDEMIELGVIKDPNESSGLKL